MFVYAGDGELTIWGLTPSNVLPLSNSIGSIPFNKVFIVQETDVWKSGWDDIDWSVNFVIHLLKYFFILVKIYQIKYT